MKILCDVHIARKVVRFLQDEGIEALHVNDILQGSSTPDTEITAFADAQN